jgi:hypothetical protein
MSDRDLERLFQDVRAADARRAPAFARVMARGTQRANGRRTLWPALAGSVALVAIVVVWRLTSHSALYELRPGEMRVPTDYLLELVTIPRAGEIPRVGVVDWFPLESSTSNRREQ